MDYVFNGDRNVGQHLLSSKIINLVANIAKENCLHLSVFTLTNR